MINTLQRAEGCRDGLLRFYVSMALGRRGLPLTYDRRREVSQIARWMLGVGNSQSEQPLSVHMTHKQSDLNDNNPVLRTEESINRIQTNRNCNPLDTGLNQQWSRWSREKGEGEAFT